MAIKKNSGSGKALAKWSEELARRAEAAKKMEENSLGLGNSISTKGGRLMYQDREIPGNKMNVVILGAVFLNTLYEGGYDPDSPTSPICYAISDTEAGMAPHEKSQQPQYEKCKGCSQNVFGTADKGRGKACQNRRRLAVITEDALTSGVAAAQVAGLVVPVTSVRNYAIHATELAETLKRPPFAVITEVSIGPHKGKGNAQWDMNFKMVREVPDESLDDLFAKADSAEVKGILHAAYMEDAPTAKPKAKTSSGKKPGAKARR